MLKEILEAKTPEEVIGERLLKAELELDAAMKIAKKKLKDGDRLIKILDPMAETIIEEHMYVQHGEYS